KNHTPPTHDHTHTPTHTHTQPHKHPDTKGCSVRPQCHSAHSLKLAGSFHAEWDDGVAGARGFRFLGKRVDGEALLLPDVCAQRGQLGTFTHTHTHTHTHTLMYTHIYAHLHNTPHTHTDT